VAKAEMALGAAPGVLAVKVEYPSGVATIGSRAGEPLADEDLLAALAKIGYRGQFLTRAQAESK
jgi:hypothetical protein